MANVELAAGNSVLRCTNEECKYHDEEPFPIILEKPVLIDFERSIISKKAYENVPKDSISEEKVANRKSSIGFIDRVHRFMMGKNRTTAGNAAKYLSLLKENASKPIMLIVGGGTIGNGMDVLYANTDLQRWSFDVFPSTNVDFVADGHSIPLPDGCVDGVWIQAVLEHVLNPDRVVAEIYRVLKPKGVVYSEIPFLQPVHEGPYDFTRFTASGHRWLYRWFDHIDSGPGRGPGSASLLALSYTLSGLLRHRRLGTAIAGLFLFWLRFLDEIMPRKFMIDAAFGSFFMGRKAEQPIHPKEMIDFYGGARSLR